MKRQRGIRTSPRQAGNRPARRGWTLLELTVVAAFSAGLTGLAGAMLVGILRVNGHGRDHVTQRGTISRLAEKFRADAAAAVRCRPADEANEAAGVVLEDLGQRRVEYRSSALGVERIAYEGERIDGRESYPLGDSQRARLEIGPESPAVVRCVLERSAGAVESGKSPIYPLRIEAILGRDRRFEQVSPAGQAPDKISRSEDP